MLADGTSAMLADFRMSSNERLSDLSNFQKSTQCRRDIVEGWFKLQEQREVAAFFYLEEILKSRAKKKWISGY